MDDLQCLDTLIADLNREERYTTSRTLHNVLLELRAYRDSAFCKSCGELVVGGSPVRYKLTAKRAEADPAFKIAISTTPDKITAPTEKDVPQPVEYR